jgi:hypothetical protein
LNLYFEAARWYDSRKKASLGRRIFLCAVSSPVNHSLILHWYSFLHPHRKKLYLPYFWHNQVRRVPYRCRVPVEQAGALRPTQ